MNVLWYAGGEVPSLALSLRCSSASFTLLIAPVLLLQARFNAFYRILFTEEYATLESLYTAINHTASPSQDVAARSLES